MTPLTNDEQNNGIKAPILGVVPDSQGGRATPFRTILDNAKKGVVKGLTIITMAATSAVMTPLAAEPSGIATIDTSKLDASQAQFFTQLASLRKSGIIDQDTYISIANESQKLFELIRQNGGKASALDFTKQKPRFEQFSSPGAIIENNLQNGENVSIDSIIGTGTITKSGFQEMLKKLYNLNPADTESLRIFRDQYFKLLRDAGKNPDEAREIGTMNRIGNKYLKDIEDMERVGTLDEFLLLWNNAISYLRQNGGNVNPYIIKKGQVYCMSSFNNARKIDSDKKKGVEPTTNYMLFADNTAGMLLWLDAALKKEAVPSAQEIEIRLPTDPEGKNIQTFRLLQTPADTAAFQRFYGTPMHENQIQANKFFWNQAFTNTVQSVAEMASLVNRGTTAETKITQAETRITQAETRITQAETEDAQANKEYLELTGQSVQDAIAAAGGKESYESCQTQIHKTTTALSVLSSRMEQYAQGKLTDIRQLQVAFDNLRAEVIILRQMGANWGNVKYYTQSLSRFEEALKQSLQTNIITLAKK